MLAGRYCAIGLFILINSSVLCHGQQNNGKKIMAFPEDGDADIGRQNAQGKTPVYMKDRCREGEILYPGDQANDWVCDCRPAHIYHPKDQKCYQVYTKGPCRPGQHFVLPKNRVVPVCEPKHSQCLAENHVWFRDGCHELYKQGPCKWGNEISNIVGVNETTLEIMCTKDTAIQVILTRVSSDDEVDLPTPKYPHKECFTGGKRWLLIKNPNETIFNSTQFQCNYCDKKLNDDNINNDSSSENQIVQNNILTTFTTTPSQD